MATHPPPCSELLAEEKKGRRTQLKVKNVLGRSLGHVASSDKSAKESPSRNLYNMLLGLHRGRRDGNPAIQDPMDASERQRKDFHMCHVVKSYIRGVLKKC